MCSVIKTILNFQQVNYLALKYAVSVCYRFLKRQYIGAAIFNHEIVQIKIVHVQETTHVQYDLANLHLRLGSTQFVHRTEALIRHHSVDILIQTLQKIEIITNVSLNYRCKLSPNNKEKLYM